MTVIPPMVDGHVHFWDLRHTDLEYTWLGPEAAHPMIGDIEGLKVARFSVGEFVAQSRFAGVHKAIHVAVSTNPDSVLETRWLQSLADQHGYPHGIVAKCDLASPNAEATLLRHLESPNMRGVRDNGAPGSFDSSQWRQNYSLLGKYELVFCHEVGLARTDEATRLVKAFPHVQFCVDHCAMPRSLDEAGFRAWRSSVGTLAELPNVVMKISALGQWGRLWTVDSVRAWISACIDAFGPSRVLFGSNFPVDGLFSPYSDLISCFRELVAGYSDEEQRDLLGRNAERIFRI